MTVVPAFATDKGNVSLAGGALDSVGVAEGKFFSDKDTFNIVTATTKDTDLSPTRTGVASFEFDGTSAVVGLLIDSVSTGATATDFDLRGTGLVVPLFKSEKDMALTFDGDGVVDTFTFSAATNTGLTGVQMRGRDRDDNGTLDGLDVVAKVAGTAVALDGTTPVTINADGYITAVKLAAVPATGVGNVEITIGMSEYDQSSPTGTPISSASFAFGLLSFTSTPNLQGNSGIINSKGIVRTGTIVAGNFVKLTFNYDVKETMTDLMTFTTPTLGSRGLTRKLDGVETDFGSNKFEAKVVLFSGSDFDKIKTADEASYAGVDTGVGNAALLTDAAQSFITKGVVNGFLLSNTTDASSCRITGVTATTLTCVLAGGTDDDWDNGDAYTVDDPQLNGLKAQIDLVDIALGTRVNAVATAATNANPAGLGFATTIDGTTFVDMSVPVADGDVLTVSYVDASPVGTRTATADIDMKAPTITQVGPAQKSFTNSLSQTLVLEVTDEPSVGGKKSGLASADADEVFVTAGGVGPTGNTVVPLFLGNDSFRVSLSKQFGSADEGPVLWHIVTKDKVGNAPATTVSGTSGNEFKFNLDITPAVPTAASASRPVVTGGKIDTRFAVPLTGSATSVGTAPLDTTQLDDANAKFMSNGVEVGDKITNTTDSSTATVTAVNSETQITHGVLSTNNTWAVGEGYKIDNPKVNTVTKSSTAVGAVSIFYDLGTGKAAIDEATASPSDFKVNGVSPASITVGAVDTAANEQGVLLNLAADLSTTDKPNVEQTGAMVDKAGNTIVTFTGSNKIAAKDGLAPVITLTVTGTAASRPVTNDKVTISIVANEDTGTPTVAVYTVGSPSVSGNAVGATVAVGTLKFVTTRSWEVDVTPGAGLYSVFASATDTGGNTGKTGVDGTSTSSDVDSADPGIQIDLTKATLFEKDTGIPAPTLLPSSTSNTGPFISADFAGEGKEYGLQACTAAGVPNVNCTAADATAGRGLLSTDSTMVTTSNDAHKTVTLMSASIDGTDVTSEVNTADNVIFLYKASGLSIGDHTFLIRVRDASGNEREFTQTVTVTERALFKLSLIPGWNMVSFPGMPADASVGAVVGNTPVTTIYTFAPTTASLWLVAVRERMEDGTFGPFIGNLTTIDPGRAYWVLTDTFEPILVDIPPLQGGADPGSTPVTPLTIEVVLGWNFIPVIDITGTLSAGATINSNTYFAGSTLKIARIYIFDTQSGTWSLVTLGNNLIVGKAYWVFATSAFTLVP